MRYRLQPTSAQEAVLLEHCSHARFVGNLAVEQHRHWRPTWRKAGVHEGVRIVGQRGNHWDVGRAARGSNRRTRVKTAIGRLKARETDRRRDWVEQTSTRLDCAAENRESQAVFRCRACRHTDHADVNAAKNIAVGRTVTARGALQPLGGAANREPQPVSSPG